ncbi:hypothetical protein KIN20_020047, partial [Parelaphostrongylus tenuis]
KLLKIAVDVVHAKYWKSGEPYTRNAIEHLHRWVTAPTDSFSRRVEQTAESDWSTKFVRKYVVRNQDKERDRKRRTDPSQGHHHEQPRKGARTQPSSDGGLIASSTVALFEQIFD